MSQCSKAQKQKHKPGYNIYNEYFSASPPFPEKKKNKKQSYLLNNAAKLLKPNFTNLLIDLKI